MHKFGARNRDITRLVTATISLAAFAFLASCQPTVGQVAELEKEQAAEFVSLFDGKSFAGWRGRPHFDPVKESAFSDEERVAKQKEWNADKAAHWSIDEANHEIVSDGHGVFLTTEKEYGDFEMVVDWKMVQPKGDSGIYVRGCPQIQIWDPNNTDAHKHGSDKGSGALWNNGEGNEGKWPLALADKPIGEWNTFRIRMIGSRVWVWFNDQLTVEAAIMENFFDRSRPIFAKGVVQLQTHGSETRFRNIKLREIDSAEANKALAALDSEGFQSLFNGRDFTGWSGPTDENAIQDGAILSNQGTIYTEKRFTDFSVQLEFKLPAAGNNGLAIRYPGEGDTAYVGMCELQVLDGENKKYVDAKPPLDARQHHGSAYGIVAAHRGYMREVGEWNFQQVTVQGSKITVELNGNVILDADLSTVDEFMADTPHPGLNNTDGHFGFAGHGDPVSYRNIKLKEL